MTNSYVSDYFFHKRMFSIAAAIFVLFLILPARAHALEVTLANLQDGQVYVSGKGAAGGAPILWEGVAVASATRGGTFNFRSEDVPASCVGELSDGTQTLFIAVNGCTAAGVIAPEMLALVPETGQTESFATGDDGDVQAGLAWPDPRFTDNEDGTVTDNLTALIWLANVDCAGGPLTWLEAFAFVAGINEGTNDCGDTSNEGSHQTDWRLPNVRELASLVDYGRSNPSLPAEHPFSNLEGTSNWSSSTNALFTGFAWNVSFSSGFVSFSGKTGSLFVIAVRGGA